jgi:cobalt-zinc-cadmium efflux system membrane fusion protein
MSRGPERDGLRAARWLALALATPLVGVGVGVGLGCARASAKSQEPPAAVASSTRTLTVDAATLARLGLQTFRVGDPVVAPTLVAPGSLEFDAQRYAQVGPKLDGRVAAVHVRLGDWVKKGDPLATMTVPSLGDAQATAIRARAGKLAAQKNAERERALLAERLTTAREAELAASELAEADAQLAAAEARLAALGVSGAAGGAAGGERAAGSIGGQLVLRAPIEGAVVARNAVLGGHLASTDVAFAIADTRQLVARIDVHERQLPSVAIGAEVALAFDALEGRTRTGAVVFIDPDVSRDTRMAKVRVAVDNDDRALRAGMSARATFAPRPGPGERRLRLPADAVQTLGEKSVVFVELRPGGFEIREVVVARRSADVVELERGVLEGERVVARGAFLLKSEASAS